ncbi:hypothetical protein C4D60_Mb04t20360 [Musa balbisiana]|uniref:Uncharacterized protein n=1 Tax=Musa balbisiana TaxID=52838 RepID=A0A4S8KDD6_MUSBA|nr:hypothetical protein C4D60_Mb04t20360 [Musa balbisiana]
MRATVARYTWNRRYNASPSQFTATIPSLVFWVQCFCYVCEVAAPCSRWNGANGHCSVYTKEGLRSEASAQAPRAGIDTKEMQAPS